MEHGLTGQNGANVLPPVATMALSIDTDNAMGHSMVAQTVQESGWREISAVCSLVKVQQCLKSQTHF